MFGRFTSEKNSNTKHTSDQIEKQDTKTNTLEKDGDTLTGPTPPHSRVQDSVDTNKADAGNIDAPETPISKEPDPVNESGPDNTLRAEEQVEGTDDQT